MPPDRVRARRGQSAGVVAIGLLYAAALIASIKPRNVLHPSSVHWATWADQGLYLQSARAFAHLDLSAQRHWYPLLYALMAAPFVHIMPGLPFVIVDAGCYLASFVGFRRVCRTFAIGPWAAAILFALTTVLYPVIGRRWAEPWTTNLSAALVWSAMGMVVPLLVPPKDDRAIGTAKAAILGVVLGLIPLARPADLVVAAILLAFATRSLIGRQHFPRLMLAIAAGGSAVLLGYAMLHLAIYGARATPYMQLSAAYGLNLRWIGWKAYLLLVEPRPWFPDGHGLLKACPWLQIGAAGMVLALHQPSERRRAALCLILCAMAYSVMMLAYVDLLPSGLWRYFNVHYFKWLLPLFGMFGWTFARGFPAGPGRHLLALLAVMLPTTIRLVPVAAPADAPARIVVFARPRADDEAIYMARSAIRDGAGRLRNFFEYHQVAEGNRVVAVAAKRDFVGAERWWVGGGAPGEVSWPPMPRNDHQPDRQWPAAPPLRPVARYRVGISWGVPCWLPGVDCRSRPL